MKRATLAIIGKYDNFATNGAGRMARDARSRSRAWFVEHDGKLWPLKALYFLVMQDRCPGRYERPNDFHTAEAHEFFVNLGGFGVVQRDPAP